MNKLVKVQKKILRNTAQLLKKGGILVYSTCSLEPEENLLLVQEFIGKNPEFSIVKSIENIPFRDQTDGAFACALKKTDV